MVDIEYYIDEFKQLIDNLISKYEFPRRCRKIKNEVYRYYSERYDIVYFRMLWLGYNKQLAHLSASFIDRKNNVLVSLNINYNVETGRVTGLKSIGLLVR